MASEVVILNSDGEEEPIALDSDTWKCTKCTYDNPFTYLVCGVCAAEKTASSPSSSSHPRKKKKAAALSSAAAAIDLSAELGGTWTCTACTLINEGGSTCQACGVPRSGPTQPTGPSASAGAQAPAGARSKSRSNGGRASTSSGRGPLYTLDCGCAIPRDVAAAAAAHRLSPQSLPLRLSQLVHHFPCPTRDDSSAENAAKQPCMQQLSHRDLEALVGAAQVAALNRKFYDAACAVQETSHADKRSNGGNGSAVGASEEQQCCERLAGCIAALHAALTGEPPTGEASGAKGQPSGQPPHAHGHKHAPYGYKNRPPHHHQARLQQHKQSGVGYAGSSEQDVALRKRLGDQAAKRQQEDDARISLLMSQLRKELAALDSGAPFGAWLSLPVVAVLHGSPLAACLRFLLTNDSLMDVVVRHTVYHEALHLLGVLSRRQDLVPLLLQKADGDVLATFAPEAKAQRAQQEKRQGKRPLGDEPGKAGGRSAKLAKTDRNRAVPTHTEEKAPEPDPAHEGAVNGVDVDLEGSCWKALQAFHLQCELFMRSAQDLADAGSEEDMDTVGTVILVQETCSLVNEVRNNAKFWGLFCTINKR